MRQIARVLPVSLLLCLPFACPHASRAESSPRPTFRAVRVEKAPTVDGDLSDPAWAAAPEIGGFTQHDPDDGKPATEKTVVKVVYDDDAIYFAARMEDSKPVTALLGRRDNDLPSDWFRINLDAQHDRLSGAAFWVNPANVQLDLALDNDIYTDSSWDGVWTSATKIVPGGWTAEVRIPFSQLRFPEKAQQTWGVNFVRKIASRNEQDRLVNTPKGESGSVSRFADLTGIDGIHRQRPLEVVPYGVARSDMQTRRDAKNPFERPREGKLDAGVDIKYGLASNLTLTGAINPDFGQVEVDPAVVNLGQFETFFPERRPFFTEGAAMFRFGAGPASSRWNFNLYSPSFFYSRRIGRSPQGSIDADYVKSPGETTILGAAKVTGKVGNGWTVGVLDAVTDRERGRYELNRLQGSQAVEPMTNYLVARSAKELAGGNSRIGFLFTSVNRRVPDELSFLRSNAYAGGIDGYTFFNKKNWLFEWLAGATLVNGSPEAIAATQTSPAHYYDRPDASYLKYDPSRTSLSGTGFRMMVGKQTGHWRPNFQVQSFSPGFETNDVGFMPRADVTAVHEVLQYTNDDTTKWTRGRYWWVGAYQNANRGGDVIANGVYGNWNVTAWNYWYAFGSAGFNAPSLDDRKTRGGPLAKSPANHDFSVGIGSDSRRKLSFELMRENFRAADGTFEKLTMLTLTYRPTSNLKLSVSPSFERDRHATQFVMKIEDAAATATYGTHYVFSTIERRTLDVGTRADWTISSRLSLQLYVQPFVATGDYHDFTELARPRSADYRPYDDPAIGERDFNFHNVRGSGVLRWEFRPGSALYLVWNENRGEALEYGDFRLRRDLTSIAGARSKDVFLLKFSYWLPM